MLDLSAIQANLDRYNRPDTCNKSKVTETVAQDLAALLVMARNATELAATWEYNARTYDIPMMGKVYKRCALRLREVLAGEASP